MDIIKHTEPLVTDVSHLIESSKQKLAIAINSELPMLYWHIGKTIYQFILNGERATYGKQVILTLSEQLTLKYGKGWSAKQLWHCLRIAETFQESQIASAVRRQLSWTHLKTIAYEENTVKRTFYLEMASQLGWNTRDLATQMDNMLFE